MHSETLSRGLRCLERLRGELLTERVEVGHWVGELSTSALSTATAVSALSVVILNANSPDVEQVELVQRGCAYLDSQQNENGGYGDTDRSHSNIATAYLVLAARTLAARVIGDGPAGASGESIDRLRKYISDAGSLDGLRMRYGTDKTFVVPILTNLAIAGLIDWKLVPRLPFEAAVFPGRVYRFLKMPVVSYAIPALVAIGQAHHFLGPRTWWFVRLCRAASVRRTTKVLRQMQPESGGYLEATPLTSFVLMSLAASSKVKQSISEDERVEIENCVSFLRQSIREDGAWPIDTNLATWVTSLAIHALARWSGDDRRWVSKSLVDWHLRCQYQVRHPFTGASPGGWGWTNLSGAVPDGDDTPAAILAAMWYRETMADAEHRTKIDAAIRSGLQWLVGLQNSDGGLPTFCRGWGRLPFDRSSTDLTAHFIRAIDQSVVCHGATADIRKLQQARVRAISFLRRTQRPDGSWLPLWFGNQDNADDENPVYGTARVLLAISQLADMQPIAARAVDYLLCCQNSDGGWGGGKSLTSYFDDAGGGICSSIEETSVAIEAIADYLQNLRSLPSVQQAGRVEASRQAIIVAVECLVNAVEANRHRHAWPIGFYFAKLWYYENLYPLVFATAAFSAALDVLNSPPHKVETST